MEQHVSLACLFIAWTRDTEHLIPKLTSFKERLKRWCLHATIISNKNNFVRNLSVVKQQY